MMARQLRGCSSSRTGHLAVLCACAFAASLLLHPTAAQAQASLAGVARDTSGAVLPGVTVEARSSVLIEKVRTAVTDGTGQYRFTELPPGTYTVTFTLPGFSIVQRQDVEVGGVGVITINADMRVGALEETITVTGETPIVDIQSSRRGTTMTNDVINALPATRGYNALVFLVPSVTGGSNQILLFLGLATRIAAVPLLGMIAVIQIFVYPNAYNDHLVWGSILVLMLTRGPGVFSLDYLIERAATKRRGRAEPVVATPE